MPPKLINTKFHIEITHSNDKMHKTKSLKDAKQSVESVNFGLTKFTTITGIFPLLFFSFLVFLIESQLISNNVSTVTFTQTAPKPPITLVSGMINL